MAQDRYVPGRWSRLPTGDEIDPTWETDRLQARFDIVEPGTVEFVELMDPAERRTGLRCPDCDRLMCDCQPGRPHEFNWTQGDQ